jgi:hypothetical protein
LEDTTQDNGVTVFAQIQPGDWRIEITVPSGHRLVAGIENPQFIHVQGGKAQFVYFNLVPT